MTRKEYVENCVTLVGIMREASAEDPALVELLNMFGLLQEPVPEDPTDG